MFNDALQNHEPLDIGNWEPILIQKQGKPAGPLTIVQPIVLLSVLGKTLSLIFPWSRNSMDRGDYLSSQQSGFRRGRRVADVVSANRWLCAKALRHGVSVEFLGIALSRAFDTIHSDRLLETLQTLS